MEQQLIDILEKAKNPEDIDDVSQAMISARVVSALMEVREATAEYLEKIRQIQKEKEMELKLAGFTLLLNTTDSLLSDKAPNQMCIVGVKRKVIDNITQLLEQANGQ